MTHWTEAAEYLDERDAKSAIARHAPGAVAFIVCAALGVYISYFRFAQQPATGIASAPMAAAPANPYGELTLAAPPPAAELRREASPFGGLTVDGFGAQGRFALQESQTAATPMPPVRPRDEADNTPLPPAAPGELRGSDDAGAPLPPRRPSLFARLTSPPTEAARPAPQTEIARVEPRTVVAPPPVSPTPQPSSSPTLIDRIFGKGSPQPAVASPDARLAYAAPPPAASSGATVVGRGGPASGGGFGDFLRGLTFSNNNASSPASRYGDKVAVYDISARMVYLPDGTRIEAHSGLGANRDDPNKVNQPMRGPTPPATYALTPRQELFHGVAALRLTPIEGSVYGRVGLLAHTYMLGPNGDSNGCISFRDYDAFLRAYRNGQINKVVVVSRL